MGNLQRVAPRTSSQLLTRILERPELTAAVRVLPVPMLATLIDRIGLEDAGEIVALASTAQLERVLDQDVWRAETAGGDARFLPERFALWLSVMLESGEAFVAEHLSQLPRETLTLAIHRLVRVDDVPWMAAREAAGHDEEPAPCEPFEEFIVCARDVDDWDVVWTCLMALDRDHHDLLRAVLERCFILDDDRREEDGLHAPLDDDALLEQDVAAAREDRQGAAGFVSAADARAFLELARRDGDSGERDPLTHGYFRALDTAADQPAIAVEAPAPRGHAARRTRAALAVQVQVQQADLAELVDLVRSEAIAPTGAADGGTTQATLFEAAMSELGARGTPVFAERLEELSYLANVLLAGAQDDQPLRPREAMQAAIEFCDAGLVQALGESRSLAAACACVESTPADRLFRAGYRRA